MREILVYEPELDHLSLLNSLAAGFFSAATGCAFFVFGVIVDARLQETISDRAWGALWVVVPGGLALTVGFALCGLRAWWAKGSETAQLKQQAKDLTIGAQQPLADLMPQQSIPDTAASPHDAQSNYS